MAPHFVWPKTKINRLPSFPVANSRLPTSDHRKSSACKTQPCQDKESSSNDDTMILNDTLQRNTKCRKGTMLPSEWVQVFPAFRRTKISPAAHHFLASTPAPLIKTSEISIFKDILRKWVVFKHPLAWHSIKDGLQGGTGIRTADDRGMWRLALHHQLLTSSVLSS